MAVQKTGHCTRRCTFWIALLSWILLSVPTAGFGLGALPTVARRHAALHQAPRSAPRGRSDSKLVTMVLSEREEEKEEKWFPGLEAMSKDPAVRGLALNALVVGMFAFFAAYKLATVDMEISRGWTFWEVLLRAPGDNFYRYEATVSEHPIITKAFTSCTAYGIGDFVAQLFQGRNIGTVDLKRSGRSALAGLLVHGPLCHYWIEVMQTYLDFDGAWWNFVPKVIADQTGWSLFLNAMYTTFVYGLQGRTPPQIWNEIKDTAWPALSSSWRFWPLIHCVSFSTLIPKDLKLLFIDCMEIAWVVILSTVANKDNQKGGHGGSNDLPEAPPAEAAAMAHDISGEHVQLHQNQQQQRSDNAFSGLAVAAAVAVAATAELSPVSVEAADALKPAQIAETTALFEPAAAADGSEGYGERSQVGRGQK